VSRFEKTTLESATRDLVMRRKHTSAYVQFENVVERALNLLSHEKRLQHSFAQIDFSDLIRAAVVLGVASMDSYFTNVFAELLVPYLRRHGPKEAMIELLGDAGFDSKVALRYIASGKPYEGIQRLVQKHLDRRTTQRPEAIDELFVAFGIKNFCHHAQQLSGRKTLLSRVKSLVDRRNVIAHDGDLDGRGKLKTISRERAGRDIRSLVLFVSKSEELINKSILKGRK
jgi:hypothetical protein